MRGGNDKGAVDSNEGAQNAWVRSDCKKKVRGWEKTLKLKEKKDRLGQPLNQKEDGPKKGDQNP